MLLNTAPITPARPKLAKTRPFPKLRSRVGKVLNVALGEGRSWPAQGWAGEISLRLRLYLPYGLANCRLSSM